MSEVKFKGAIFDLDGVITGTARLHSKAWEKMFNEYLKMVAERDEKPFVPFDPEKDYLEYVDGKLRQLGVKSFLESRGISLPLGDLDDPPEKETLGGLGNKKNIDFQKVLKEEGPDIFQSSVDFIKDLKKKGIKVAVASSSRNCKLILELAGLEDLFETRVDGEVSKELKLKSKPAGDIFVVAAKKIGLLPGECVVFEDAISGVQAGKNGNFGLILGVAREKNGDTLFQHGADIVVEDLSEISIQNINNWFEYGIGEDGWHLTHHDFDPKNEKLRETLTTVGNGYLGTRGCFEGAYDDKTHYPGIYIAGIYNKTPTIVHDKEIFNNDLVNCPNWLLIEFKIGKSEYQNPLSLNILSYKQNLNMKEAILENELICKDGLGRITKIKSGRIASMANPHTLATQYKFTPLNYSGVVTFRSSINGNIINNGVERYNQLNQKHLVPVASGKTKDGIFLCVKTTHSKYQISLAAKTLIFCHGELINTKRSIIKNKAFIGEEFSLMARENISITLEKLVSVYTSVDKGIKNPKISATNSIVKLKNYNAELTPHIKAWDNLWQKSDIQIHGDRFSQRVARLHTYHLLITASTHNRNIDAGMPARGLHGEAYRGHIFWDELYIMPFYNLHFPEIAKPLLMYRYNRLKGAKQYAIDNGYAGAMYPWQTCDGGDEETQVLHFNPKDGSWGPDLSCRQRHVSIAVFYNTWKYISDTEDTQFLEKYGAELMLEIARFWASIAIFDESTVKYHIEGVMGPDEFHEKLPGSKTAGIKDNAYTNVMVVWLLEKAMEVLKTISKASLIKLKKKIHFNENELNKWQDIITKLNVIVSDGIISQFDGYLGLKELDWSHYKEQYGDIHRLDRILKAEGSSPDEYKLAKQADTLMMFYAIPPEEACRILNQLGQSVDDPIKLLKNNYEFYEKRTSHGSTLSKVVHAVMSGHMNKPITTWEWFQEVLESDIYDTQGGTTLEGIHTGAMAGALDIIFRYFAGIDTFHNNLEINPNIPPLWSKIKFRAVYKNKWYNFEFKKDTLTIKLEGNGKKPVPIIVKGKKYNLLPGKTKKINI